MEEKRILRRGEGGYLESEGGRCRLKPKKRKPPGTYYILFRKTRYRYPISGPSGGEKG